MYMETYVHIVYLKYRTTRAMNGCDDESNNVQVGSHPPPLWKNYRGIGDKIIGTYVCQFPPS